MGTGRLRVDPEIPETCPIEAEPVRVASTVAPGLGFDAEPEASRMGVAELYLFAPSGSRTSAGPPAECTTSAASLLPAASVVATDKPNTSCITATDSPTHIM